MTLSLGTYHYSPQGVPRFRKDCLHGKNFSNNLLVPEGASEKLSAEATPVMQDLGNYKNCLHNEWREKNLQALNQWWKNFLHLKNHYTPGEIKIIAGPLIV